MGQEERISSIAIEDENKSLGVSLKNMITSTSNKRMKDIAMLQKKAGIRNKEGVFVVEGIKMFQECPKSDILEIVFGESFVSSHGKIVQELERDCRCPIHYVSDTVFAYVSDTKTPQGILLLVKQKKSQIKNMLTKPSPVLLLLDNIQDPGNLGTILRASEGAGITGIIISEDSCDVFNPKVIRSTMGSIFRLDICISTDLETEIKKLKSIGIKIFVTDLEESVDYDMVDFTKSNAIVIGNESKGVSKRIKDLADIHIKIPMLGKVESLNVGVATSILAYEMARQRRRQHGA